jgi:phosphohistidine phosphatase
LDLKKIFAGLFGLYFGTSDNGFKNPLNPHKPALKTSPLLTIMSISRTIFSKIKILHDPMKSLLLLRHAEATPQNPETPDIRRLLSKHGESQCRTLSVFFKNRDYAPDRIECSSALRAQQTARLIINGADWKKPSTVYDHLYNAGREELFARVCQQKNDVTQLALIAHAPGLAELLMWLISETGNASFIFPPATVAEIFLDVETWSDVKIGCGAVRLILPGQ